MELAQKYTRQWPVQENAIRDWLTPLGIDFNHGYAKTLVINSEMAKKREALQRRIQRVALDRRSPKTFAQRQQAVPEALSTVK